MESVWQHQLPDSLLLLIFECLGVGDLGCVAQTCCNWRRVAYDDLLWQKLMKHKFKIKGPLSPGKTSWRSELKRLLYHSPVLPFEKFTDTDCHTDEVLDVTISHNGKYFCSTSKDSKVLLWMLGYPSTVYSRVNTASLLSWNLTQYSRFNEDDSLVLVCGVKLPQDVTDLDHYPDISIGYGAVFSVPDLIPQFVPHCVVPMDPPTMFGAWLTKDVFIGGELKGQQGTFRIQAHKVPAQPLPVDDVGQCCIGGTDPVNMFTFRGHKHHLMSVLVAIVHSGSRGQGQMDCVQGHDPGTGAVSSFAQNQSNFHVEAGNSFHGDVYNTGCQDGNHTVHNSDRAGPLYCDTVDGRRLENSGATRVDKCVGSGDWPEGYCEGHICDTACDEERMTDTKCSDRVPGEDSGGSDIRMDQEMRSTDCPLDIESRNFYLPDVELCNTPRPGQSNHLYNVNSSVRKYVIFVTGTHDTIAVKEITSDKEEFVHRTFATRARGTVEMVPEDGVSEHDVAMAAPVLIDNRDHVFHIKGCYITGMCLSHDERCVYFNYREVKPYETEEGEVIEEDEDEEEEFPDISDRNFHENLLIGVIDLERMERLEDVIYSGHVGYSAYPAWYICLDSSQDYIGSGSEDARAYLWDRHYRVNFARLGHTFGVVNGICFNPVDQECLITVCDDKSIVVWRSRHAVKKLTTAEAEEDSSRDIDSTLNMDSP